MKRFLTALALLLVVAGCSNAPAETEKPQDENKPAAITTLDTATFVSEMENTAVIKVFVADYEDLTATAVEEHLSHEDEVVKEISGTLASLNLEKASDQNKVYGMPLFFIDLNSVVDSNYTRFVVFEGVAVVQTNEGFVNYTLDDAATETLKGLTDSLIETFTPEE